MVSVLSASRSFPVEVPRAFDVLLPAPLPRIFAHRSGPIPPVRSVAQEGLWGEVGQQRTVVLADGTTMRETLTEVTRPDVFAYRLDDISGRMRHLVDHVDGRWTFDPVGTGVRITWTWQVTPASVYARAGVPAFARFWRGYARDALEAIEDLLLDA
jgi:hypothetical protein